MNKIQSVAEVTTWDGKRTLILRLTSGANASLLNGAFYLDGLTLEDLRRLIHACQQAAMMKPEPVDDAEFGNDAPYSQTVVLPSYGKR